ncbi:MAG: ABC transporter permease, partial [Candidatus Rokuibacteriota bacterium]
MTLSRGPGRRRGSGLVWLFLAPSLLVFLLYRVIPLGWNVVLSFEHWSP